VETGSSVSQLSLRDHLAPFVATERAVSTALSVVAAVKLLPAVVTLFHHAHNLCRAAPETAFLRRATVFAPVDDADSTGAAKLSAVFVCACVAK